MSPPVQSWLGGPSRKLRRLLALASKAVTDLFSGPPDPRDVRARVIDFFQAPGLDRWSARVWIDDNTNAEGFEVLVQVSDSLRCLHPLESADIECAVARHINLWSSEHRLVAARARAEMGGEYVLGGDSESLYLTEPPILIPAFRVPAHP